MADGAGNIVPTLPLGLSQGAPAITDLNELSYAASFLINHNTRPTWKFIAHTVSGSITANTWTPVTYDTNIFDSDSVQTAGTTWPSATIVTQGTYHVEACTQVQNTAARLGYSTAFKWIAGSASPYSAQSPGWFGFRGTTTGVTGSGSACQVGVMSAITPVPMYPGDTLQVMVFMTATGIWEPNDNSGQPSVYTNGRMSMQFTGRWLRIGS